MFGVGRLAYVTVILLNALAILNEERFISRLFGQSQSAFGTPEDSIETRFLGLAKSSRTLARPFLIIFNTLIITYELILG